MDKTLRDFYHDRLVPLADLAEREGIEFFPLGPADDASSYYIDRNDTGEYVHEINSEKMADELIALWDGGLHELQSIAPALIELANLLREPDDTTDEISPFIYAMF